MCAADTTVMGTTRDQVTIAGELAVLNVEELAISAHRSDLHQQIDVIYLGAPLGIAKSTLLARLEDEEVDLSARRRGLHQRIDVLRAEAGLPAKRERAADHST
jgi:hypothetical protein